MRHTLIHSIKLFFARIRWTWKLFYFAYIYLRTVKEYISLTEMKDDIHDRLLARLRVVNNPDDPEASYLRGQLELIIQIIEYGRN